MQTEMIVQILTIILDTLGIVALLLILGYTVYGEDVTEE